MRRLPATLVEVENLSVSTPRGRQLFVDLNVQISHDPVAMIGRNGVGKSTLLQILSGDVDRPTEAGFALVGSRVGLLMRHWLASVSVALHAVGPAGISRSWPAEIDRRPLAEGVHIHDRMDDSATVVRGDSHIP